MVGSSASKEDMSGYPAGCSGDAYRDFRDQPTAKSPTPITPKMLMKALQRLKKKSLKGLFFTPKEVAFEILRKYPSVEQDLDVLLLEVTDKLVCASAAGLVGSKQDSGYYAFDLRQEGLRSDTRSELMFWLFYKKILNRKLEDERRKVWAEKKSSDCSPMTRKRSGSALRQ